MSLIPGWQICRRCRWYRGCTLTCEYLCECSIKFELVLMEFSEAEEKLIHEKKPEANNLATLSLWAISNFFIYPLLLYGPSYCSPSFSFSASPPLPTSFNPILPLLLHLPPLFNFPHFSIFILLLGHPPTHLLPIPIDLLTSLFRLLFLLGLIKHLQNPQPCIVHTRSLPSP